MVISQIFGFFLARSIPFFQVAASFLLVVRVSNLFFPCRSKNARRREKRDSMGDNAMANGAKKKRTNRSARLKRSKFDARREQLLSPTRCEDDCKISGEDQPPLSRKDASDNRISVMGEDEAPHRRRHTITYSSSPSVTDAEEEHNHVDDGVLDDWEAVADAISEANDLADHEPDSLFPLALHSVAASPIASQSITKPEPIRSAPRAWEPDDASRPRSLPSISKQWSLHAKTDRQCSLVGQQKGILSLPCRCPICYENLDPTDSSFFPCCCGFRLCLFCHKRILEDDARCPGCRRAYNSLSNGPETINFMRIPPASPWLSRSFSMISRSCSREH
ncbi:uncharacterized protein LOC121989920 [Zingiber officinale]|uniref:RING-type domain-containing protein n=1 Tax=Zingiber officinale TaxID=94328 RepID=A0A8J5KTK6_ZINOF|nr:uncharacterized protein LOC121989920 [Zingiber officinale]KAG6494859.1 hypothetical protein ZIOFF_042641 [Zingiber officinale]